MLPAEQHPRFYLVYKSIQSAAAATTAAGMRESLFLAVAELPLGASYV